MNADEIEKAKKVVRALREGIECHSPGGCISCMKGKTAQAQAADLIESLQAQLTDYHHMEQLVDGKMAENQRLRKINEKLQSQLAESQRKEKADAELIRKIYFATDEDLCDCCRKIVRMIEAWWNDDEKGEAE